jgi:hypothetical protein
MELPRSKIFMVKGNSNSETGIEGNTKDMGVDTKSPIQTDM